MGHAGNRPRLTVDPSRPGPSNPPQQPCLVLEHVGGTVTLLGVDVGGDNSAVTFPKASGLVTDVSTGTFSGPLRVLHASVEAPQWGQLFGYGPSSPALVANAESLVLVDVTLRTQAHQTDAAWCEQSVPSGGPGAALAVPDRAATVLVLDSELTGGGGLEPASYDDFACAEQFFPGSCAELSGGAGGPALSTNGTLWHAGSEFLGGSGAQVSAVVGSDVQPGFPCSLADGAPLDVGSERPLDGVLDLTSSGAIVSEQTWTLRLDTPAPAFLLIGRPLEAPLELAAGALFVDPAQLIVRPVPAGVQLRDFEPGTLREEWLGDVLAVQLVAPGVGFSRPVLAGLLPH